MDRKQFFGWTEPETPAEGYVKYLAAFDRTDGAIDIDVRDSDGRTTTITLPAIAFAELGQMARAR